MCSTRASVRVLARQSFWIAFFHIFSFSILSHFIKKKSSRFGCNITMRGKETADCFSFEVTEVYTDMNSYFSVPFPWVSSVFRFVNKTFSWNHFIFVVYQILNKNKWYLRALRALSEMHLESWVENTQRENIHMHSYIFLGAFLPFDSRMPFIHKSNCHEVYKL